MNKIILCLLLIAIAFVGVYAVAASDVDDVIVPNIEDHSFEDIPTVVFPGDERPVVEPTSPEGMELIPLSILEGFSDNGLAI